VTRAQSKSKGSIPDRATTLWDTIGRILSTRLVYQSVSILIDWEDLTLAKGR